MATIKLKPQPVSGTVAGPRKKETSADRRGPVRGPGSAPRQRPTLAQAQAERAERAERAARVQQADRRERPPEPAAPPRETRHESAGPRRKPPRVAAPKLGPDDHQVFDPEAFERARAARRAAQRDDPGTRHAPPREASMPVPVHDRAPDRRPARAADRSTKRGAVAPAPRPLPQGPAMPRRAPPRPARDDDDGDDDRPAHAELPGSLRLSKRMSQLGLASRREADEWIAKGWVRVDGRVVDELGSRVLPGQQVTLDARARGQQAQKVTVLLNKPVGYVSGQAEDGYEPALVLVTPANQWRDDTSGTRFLRGHLRSLVPAGRLDIDSVGLLVLTQDGRVAKQLIGEDSDIEKEYLVRVAPAEGQPLSADGLALLNHGLELDGEALRPARVEWVNDDQLRFVLKQGKKRQIRRMCEAVGLQVLGLKRVRIGGVMLGDLPTGQWRYLRADEAFAS